MAKCQSSTESWASFLGSKIFGTILALPSLKTCSCAPMIIVGLVQLKIQEAKKIGSCYKKILLLGEL